MNSTSFKISGEIPVRSRKGAKKSPRPCEKCGKGKAYLWQNRYASTGITFAVCKSCGEKTFG